MSRGPGLIQRRILLLLLGGAALGLSGSPRGYFRILKGIRKEWQEINRDALRRAIRGLYESKLVTVSEGSGGLVTLVLSDGGRRFALSYKLDEMKIQKPRCWDGKWRVITFDIPEKQKKVREALRYRFCQLGLKELQKSVFVYPYSCDNEIDFLIEFYQVRPYVRKILAESIDNELHLKHIFNLSERRSKG